MQNPAILQYGMQSKTFAAEAFPSLEDAWAEYASELGAEPSRRIMVRNQGHAVDLGAAPLAGQTYSISIAMGDKGIRD